MCVYVKVEDNLWESALSYSEYSKDQTPVSSLGNRCLYSLSHPSRPQEPRFQI